MRLFLIALALVAAWLAWKFNSVRLKAGVSIDGLNWRMFWAALVAEPIFKLYGGELVITAGLDGDHMQNSKHYEGLAIDLRTRDVGGRETQVASALRAALGSGYDVVLESDHIHVEWDPKGDA